MSCLRCCCCTRIFPAISCIAQMLIIVAAREQKAIRFRLSHAPRPVNYCVLIDILTRLQFTACSFHCFFCMFLILLFCAFEKSFFRPIACRQLCRVRNFISGTLCFLNKNEITDTCSRSRMRKNRWLFTFSSHFVQYHYAIWFSYMLATLDRGDRRAARLKTKIIKLINIARYACTCIKLLVNLNSRHRLMTSMSVESHTKSIVATWNHSIYCAGRSEKWNVWLQPTLVVRVCLMWWPCMSTVSHSRIDTAIDLGSFSCLNSHRGIIVLHVTCMLELTVLFLY